MTGGSHHSRGAHDCGEGLLLLQARLPLQSVPARACLKRVCCLHKPQAAVTVARRVAWEKKVELGQEVGC